MTKFNFLLIIILFISCNSQKEYSDLDELYSDFFRNLKDSNTENLKNYCHRIVPDQETINYLKNNGLPYRETAEQIQKRKSEPSYLGDRYYGAVLEFKGRLIRKNQLSKLKYLGRENNSEELVSEKLNIYMTETAILMESKGDTIRYVLGEIYKVNGKWRSYSSPKRLGW